MMINRLIPIGFSRNGGNNERDTFLSCRFEKNLTESEKGRERERDGERALSDRRYPSNEP
jgi:hypothetical protein